MSNQLKPFTDNEYAYLAGALPFEDGTEPHFASNDGAWMQDSWMVAVAAESIELYVGNGDDPATYQIAYVKLPSRAALILAQGIISALEQMPVAGVVAMYGMEEV
jgi:hypothetical protein